MTLVPAACALVLVTENLNLQGDVSFQIDSGLEKVPAASSATSNSRQEQFGDKGGSRVLSEERQFLQRFVKLELYLAP